jgi:hypothetical protein
MKFIFSLFSLYKTTTSLERSIMMLLVFLEHRPSITGLIYITLEGVVVTFGNFGAFACHCQCCLLWYILSLAYNHPPSSKMFLLIYQHFIDSF